MYRSLLSQIVLKIASCAYERSPQALVRKETEMAVIKADADALDHQGSLHHQIAQFYREAAAQMKQQGENVASTFEQWKSVYGTQYRGDWLHPSIDDLLAEADKHDEWSTFFTNLATQIRLAEGQLSGY
jgi:hypothetical protein